MAKSLPWWCVRDEMMGRCVLIEAKNSKQAARLGYDALVEDYPSETTCEHCESETLQKVEVFPLDRSAVETFQMKTVLVPA